MLYTFTHYATLYELYVGLLRGLIAVAVALSMLISVDRIYKVCSLLLPQRIAWWTTLAAQF